MPIYQVTIEQLATVSTIIDIEAPDEDAAAELAIEVRPAQDWESAWRGSECTGYEVLEVEGVA